jgi:catechol 2,3-dioxygenase
MEERGHHCVILQRGEEAVAGHLGFKVFSEDDLDRAQHHFRARGLKAEFVEEPFQGRTLRTVDPLGVPLEFYFRMEKLPSITRSTLSTRASNPCGSTTSTASRTTSMLRWRSTIPSASG